MVTFKTNSPIAEPIKPPPHPEVPVSDKNLHLFQYCTAFPVKSFFKETTMRKKMFVYIINMQLST